MFSVLLLVAALQLPPISWTCPMHPDVVEDAGGACPICRMPLEPIRLALVWSCPIHSVIASEKPGRCPVCGRDLMRITMALTWTCGDSPAAPRLEPFRCPDGMQAAIKYTPRPHGNHNPQHGGQFFMAPDNWHHLEGAYPRAGVFRLYLYDDYSKPLPREQVRYISGRVTVGTTDIALHVAPSGEYLEGQVPLRLPVELTAKLRFQPNAPEHRFDFAFTLYSADQPPQQTARAPAAYEEAADTEPKPESVFDLATALHERAEQIQLAIARRAYSEIWVPALQAKDIAVSIDAAADGPEPFRFAVRSAAMLIVRAAWLLDAVGDQGNAEEISAAHARFTAAIARLDAALAAKR